MSVKSILLNMAKLPLGILEILLGALVVCGSMALLWLFIVGSVRVGEKIIGWLMLFCVVAFAINIIILAPFALIRTTRRWAAIGFFISSYVFGVTAWFMGLLLTWSLWGAAALVIGLLLMGIGVVPFGILATLFKGMWTEFGLLVLAVGLTWGLRILGEYLMDELSGDCWGK